jgi:hypothetical protein
MKWQAVDLISHSIGFHQKLQKEGVSVRKMNAVLGSGKALYADIMPPIFVEQEEGKLTLIGRHWAYDLARSRAMMTDGRTKTLVLVAERADVNKVLELDAMEIMMLTKMKTTKAPDTKKQSVPEAEVSDLSATL